jgi:energy-coupling factor transport system ATP-binding protein
VEHRLENILEFLDEILVFENGQIIQRGKPQSILNDSLIYDKGIDLSPILLWYKQLKDQKIWAKNIPINFDDQVQGVINEFQKCFNPLSKSLSESKISVETDPVIVLDQISFSYASKYAKNHAVNDVSLAIQRGEIVGILGPNGAGKSTLVKSLTNLRHPQSGHIFLNNRETTNLPTYELAQNVGVMFQNPDHQLFASSVEEEILFSLKSLHLPQDQLKLRIEDILSTLSITEFRNKSPFLISGGQKKRVGLATILCRDPGILVFDEPTIGQDAHQKEILKRLIVTLQKQGKTILIITHDMDFIVSIASRLIVMKQGGIFADASPSDIFRDINLLKMCSLCQPRTIALIQAVRNKITWIPQEILSIPQLQEVWTKCR